MTEQDTHEEAALDYVGFWVRFLAFIIDSVLVSIALIPISLLMYGQIMPGMDQQVALSDTLLQLLCGALIVVMFWMYRQATPGKMLFSARIADADTGGVPNATQLVIRYFGYFVSTLPFFLGFLWIGFDKRKQAWHDKMAGTVVIRNSLNVDTTDS